MVPHWSLSESKSPQVSRILLSNLTNLNKVSICPLISKSSSPCINTLMTAPRAPITISITVTSMFHSFSNSLARSWYLSFFSFSFNFTVYQENKVHYSASSLPFFLSIMIRSGSLPERRSLRVSFSWTNSWLSIYYLFAWSKLNFLHNSYWITLSTQSCLVLYSFCISLLHSLIM